MSDGQGRQDCSASLKRTLQRALLTYFSLPAAYHSGYSCERGRDAPRSVGARAGNRVNEQSSRWATLSAREGVNLVKGVTPMTTVKDVQRAQVLIERCMLTYMPFEEVQTKLHHESDVEPALTQIVWRKLQVAPLPTSRSPACLCPPHWPHIASIHASAMPPRTAADRYAALAVVQLHNNASQCTYSSACVPQEANPRFFEHYLLRVRLKEQLVAFASLLAPSDGLAVNPLQTPRDEAP